MLRPGVAVLWNYEVAAGEKKREDNLGACEDKKASSSKAEGFSCPRAPCQIARSSTPRPEAPCSPLCSNGGHLGRRQWCVPAAALRPEWAQQEAAALCSERRHGYRARGAQRAAQAGRELARRARRPPAVAASACIGEKMRSVSAKARAPLFLSWVLQHLGPRLSHSLLQTDA
jgi:hypothetical protein